MKKVISIILAVMLACSVVSVTAFAEAAIGDANGDGNITAVDARMILQVVAGLSTAEDEALYDVNGDGNITAVDARLVLQIVAGLSPDINPKPDTKLETDEEKLAYFVKSFNGVKENASSVTLVGNKVYNYNDYIYVNPLIEALDSSIKDQLVNGFSDELNTSNSATYTGENIALRFPPAGGTCNLQMADVSKIKLEEDGEYYIVEVTVKGKKNPARYESVGNVATIVTKADLEAEMSPEDLEYMSMECEYKDAVAKAKIEKATGNMVEYNVDYPMILSMNVTSFGTALAIGMGLYEEWTIAY